MQTNALLSKILGKHIKLLIEGTSLIYSISLLLLMKSILPTDGIYSSYWWNLFFLLMESILPIDGTTFSLVHA